MPVMPNDSRYARDAALRKRLEDRAIPDLPIDGDPPETRHKAVRAGDVMGAILAKLLEVRSPFMDEVRHEWKALFPNLPATPGRFESGRLFLYVRSSAAVFSMRAKLPKIHAALQKLQTAPKKFSVHLEIHACTDARNSLK